MKFKRHKVTREDWLVVLAGILLGIILIWLSTIVNSALIKRMWSSLFVIYFIGIIVNRMFGPRRKVDKVGVSESVKNKQYKWNGMYTFYATIFGIVVAIGVIIALICGIYNITVVELFIKLFTIFKTIVYIYIFGGILLLFLPFIIIGKFF